MREYHEEVAFITLQKYIVYLYICKYLQFIGLLQYSVKNIINSKKKNIKKWSKSVKIFLSEKVSLKIFGRKEVGEKQKFIFALLLRVNRTRRPHVLSLSYTRT
jgi:hypothetical protein